MNDEQNKEQLAANASAELTPEDKKIAAKRAKKKSVPVEVAEEARRQELNAKQAQMLTIEYNEKLNALGFVLQPVLRRFPDSLVAGFDLRPMDANEMAQYNARKGKGQAEPVAKTDEAKPEDLQKDDSVEPSEAVDVPA